MNEKFKKLKENNIATNLISGNLIRIYSNNKDKVRLTS